MENPEKNWFDKYYKLLMLIPILLVIISLFYIGNFYSKNNDFFLKDVSLSGGTVLTLTNVSNLDVNAFENSLREKFSEISLRKLTNSRTGEISAIILESSEQPNDFKTEVEKLLGYTLNNDNSSTEFTGSALSANFYKQLVLAIVLAFVLMSLVILILFRSVIPSFAVIFAAFSNIVIPLAIVNYFGIRLSAAGIAAFLMLIGYSVDTDILLTTRAIKNREGTLNSRIFRAFKTGILMTLTALAAVLPAFFLITGLPDSFKQIFLILALGLTADILNTWLTNAGLIKWYCTKKGIN